MKKELSDSIFDYLYGILNGLVYDGEDYPVYTVAEKGKRKFILLNANYSDDPVYGTEDYECAVTIEINSIFDNRASLKGVNSIAREVIHILNKQKWGLEGYGITSGPFLVDTRIDYYSTEVGTLIKKTIIFTLKTQEE